MSSKPTSTYHGKCYEIENARGVQVKIKIALVLGVIGFSLMLTGCKDERVYQPTYTEPTLKEVNPNITKKQPTPTPTSTPTFSHVSSSGILLTTSSTPWSPKPTYTTGPTYTPRPTSTPTRLPTAPLLPTLSTLQGLETIGLVTPSPDDLLKLLKVINNQHAYYSANYTVVSNSMDASYSPLLKQQFDFTLKELDYANIVLGGEIKESFSDGFPDSQIVWEYYPLPEEWFNQFPDEYLDLLTYAVFDQINSEKKEFVDKNVYKYGDHSIQSYQVEIDGDQGREWLVLIRWEAIGALTWLALDEREGLSYTRLNNELPPLNWNSKETDDGIEFIADFTGDKRTDVIFLDYGYLMGTDFGTFYIAQGTPDGFELIDHVSISNPGYLSMGLPYTIDKPENSNWLTLTISNPNSINWDCYWDTTSTYRWPYGEKQVQISGVDAPNTPDCYLARAVNLDAKLDNITAIRLIENAIAHFDLTDPIQMAKAQFGHFRLAILYALEGMDFSARQNLTWFIDHYNKSDAFQNEKLLPLLDDTRINPIKVCSTLEGQDYSVLPNGWEEYVNATAALNAYPMSNDVYPPAICPLRSLITDKLMNLQFDPLVSPESALIAAGIPQISIQAYPAPDSIQQAWFVILGTETKYVAGYVPSMEGWKWVLMYRFDPSLLKPIFFNDDVTGDGYPEYAIISAPDFFWGCNDDEQRYELFLTTATNVGLVSTSESFCNDKGASLDLPGLLADTDGDGLVDWVVEQLKQYTDDSSLTAERTEPLTWFSPSEISSWIGSEGNYQDNNLILIQELYSSANQASIREELLKLREDLDPNDIFSPQIWQRLTYLIGVSYEFEGNDSAALEAYLLVVKAEPKTIWDNLAAMHIQNK